MPYIDIKVAGKLTKEQKEKINMNSREDEYLLFAKTIALKAGKIARKLRPTAYIKTQKDGLHNYATNADIQVEKFLLSQIQKKYLLVKMA